MVSTYFGYSYITRNLKQSLTRIEQQTDVAREAAYYKANIGKVKTVDDFMKDYRLYHYATKAYGLEDMAYAKAFMKKVLESDLTDANSFANKLSDTRYKEFASAFNFNAPPKDIQTDLQEDDLIGLYNAGAGNEGIAAALEASGRSLDIVWIAHELTGDTRRFLLGGIADAVINQDPGHEARSAARVLLARCLDEPIIADQERIRIEIFLRDNLP